MCVAIRSQDPAPTRTQTIPRSKTSGWSSKSLALVIPVNESNEPIGKG